MLLVDRILGSCCICCKFWEADGEDSASGCGMPGSPRTRWWLARDRTACVLGRPECALSFLGQSRLNVPWGCSRGAEEERARKEGFGEVTGNFKASPSNLPHCLGEGSKADCERMSWGGEEGACATQHLRHLSDLIPLSGQSGPRHTQALACPQTKRPFPGTWLLYWLWVVANSSLGWNRLPWISWCG